MSSTTMPTRSNPIVSCLSMACAMATLVPTPSVLVARTGRVIRASAVASNMRSRVEHAGEATQPAQHLGALRELDRDLDQLDGPVARLDVHTGFGVRDGRVFSGRAFDGRGVSRHGSVSLGLRTWVASSRTGERVSSAT